MSLPRFHYHAPATLFEAGQMLREFGNTAALLAGGTDLLVKMKNRLLQPQHVVSLVGLEEIQRIHSNTHHVSIGSCCALSQITQSKEIQSVFPALASGAGHIGSPAVRNLGTLGGNIVTASPAADMPPALIAYRARARLKSGDGERLIPIEQFFNGPGSTQMEPDEILTDIQLDKPPEFSGAAFFKHGTRKALQISVVNGACYLALDPQSGEIREARIVLGAVAPTHIRIYSAENMLTGQIPTDELFQEAGREASRVCSPIDDLRGSGEYRRDTVQVMTSRMLRTALQEAR